jgi:ABC-2 type transport system ATP-binding protein
MIRAEDLWKNFGRHTALRGMTFSVPEGSTLALIGANGAGKTTAIRVLLNIVAASRGRASIIGVDSRKLSARELRRIGYVSEDQHLPDRLTVSDYLCYLRPLYPRWNPRMECALISRFHLPSGRRIGDLSHGMRMKLKLACALPFQPDLLILDEPFSGLDPLVRDEFMEGLLDQAGQMTLLVSTHDLAEIENVATDVAFVDEGTALFQESITDLMSRFREVRVTMDVESEAPCEAPEHWLQVRPSGAALNFVEAHYREELLGERIRSLVRGVRTIDTQPMSLRSIFTALARAARDKGRRTGGA